MPTARGQLAAAAAEGVLYVVGGDLTGGGGTVQSALEAYDPLTNSWTIKTPGDTGDVGPKGDKGDPGQFVSGTILFLRQGSAPPAGFVFVGTMKQSLPRASGPAVTMMMDVYVKP